MAERVVPVLTPQRVLSRPERVRGRHFKRLRWLVAVMVGVAIVLATTVVTAHFLVIDHAARTMRATGLIPEGSPARVLVVVAHPGDELQVAGTIAELTRAGATVTELSLTSGEARDSSHLASRAARDRLGRIRREEFQRAAEVLGVHRAQVADVADGTLMAGDPAAAAGQIAAAAAKARASVIIAVGAVATTDSDSQAVIALATRAAQNARSSVARVWEVTRGSREADWISRVAGPVINTAGLTPADAAVRIEGSGPAKTAVMLAHATQRPILGADYPWADLVPARAYFRFLDREYFHLVWGQQLP
jgi:LmbE family N-acetylglucosaminyl deacetylase